MTDEELKRYLQAAESAAEVRVDRETWTALLKEVQGRRRKGYLQVGNYVVAPWPESDYYWIADRETEEGMQIHKDTLLKYFQALWASEF